MLMSLWKISNFVFYNAHHEQPKCPTPTSEEHET